MANTKRNRKVHAAGILLSLCALGGVAAAAPNVLFAPEAVITASAYEKDGCSLVVDTNAGTVTLEQYTGSATSLTLPYHPNYPSYKYIVGASAFEGNTTLTSVTIPNKYKTINTKAFYGLTKMTSLTLNEGLETIGSSAFWHTGIQTLTLPKSIKTIYSYAFQSNMALTSVSWKGDVSSYTSGDEFALTEIYQGAFRNCTSLKDFPTLPYTVTYLGEGVFYNDTSLISVDLDYVNQNYVPKNTCYNCTALRTVYLPQKALQINYHAFYGAGSANANSDKNVNIYHRSSVAAINTNNGAVKSRVVCLNESGNATNWGAAFEKATKITFRAYPNSALDYGYHSTSYQYAGKTSIKKLADGSANNTNTAFVYYDGTTKSYWDDSYTGKYWFLSKVPYPLPGKIYHASDVVLDSRRSETLKITSTVCKDARTGNTLADGKPFQQGTSYYYEVTFQPINFTSDTGTTYKGNINLENLKQAISGGYLKVTAEPDKAGVATNSEDAIYYSLVRMSLGSASSKPTITLRCYVDFSEYKDGNDDKPYYDSYSDSNSGSEPKDLYGNKTHTIWYLKAPTPYMDQTYASNGQPRMRLNLEPIAGSGNEDKGNIFDQRKYWNAGAANVWYAYREKGSSASLNYQKVWTLNGLEPEKTYNVYFSSSSNASGNFYTYEFKAPPVLNLKGASLSLEDSLNLIYKARLTDSFKKTGAYTQFKVQTPTGVVNKYATISDPEDGVYSFPVKLAAKQLNDNVTFSGYTASNLPSNWVLTKNSAYTYIPERTFTYTAMKYLNSVIKNNSNEKIRALAQATKDYGILAQTNFGYNVSAISNEDQNTALENISGIDATDFEQFAPVTSGSKPTGFKSYSISFACESESLLHIRFNLQNSSYSIENYTCQYKKSGSNNWITINPVETAANQYTFDLAGIKAKDLDRVYDFRVISGGKTYNFSISAMTYFWSQRNTTNEKMLNLSKAIFLYNQAANDAFES